MKRLFGTDGVRGRANTWPMTGEIALKLGMAVAHHFRHEKGTGRILIGKDTRLSGYMFETALCSGITAMGMDVLLVGPMPTPGIAFLTREMRADAGVVISASHNPFEDNGIKIFDRTGLKLPDAVEMEIEDLILSGRIETLVADSADIGKAFRIDDASGRYITHLKNTFPAPLTLDDFKVVLDCANGAAYRIAPLILSELGAEVIALGVQPDGKNINDGVGSLHPAEVAAKVVESGAQIGIALDGDADRVVFCDEKGEEVDGDAVIAIFARDLKRRGLLKGGCIAATTMSNMGLNRALEAEGIAVHSCDVGDRYVLEALLANGLNFGGERSGHLIFLDNATTGDGMLAALQMLAVLAQAGQPLSALKDIVTPIPQRLTGIRVAEKTPLEQVAGLQRAIEEGRRLLGRYGKIVVRYSGTEPLVRVLVEGEDAAQVGSISDNLGHLLQSKLGIASPALKTVNA